MTNRRPVTDLTLDQQLPTGPLVIEASAGTGKTYSVAALVVRHVAEEDLPTSSLLVVTFTRAAAAELRDRIRRALVQARDACDSGVVPADQQWMSVLLVDPVTRATYRDRLALAVTTFDDATISTIHGFCQQALTQIGVRSGRRSDARLSDRSLDDVIEEVCLDLLIARLCSDPTDLAWSSGKTPASPSKLLSTLQEAVREVLRSPSAERLPSVQQRDHLADPVPQWAELVEEAAELVRTRRADRLELGYDDLVLGLHQALCLADDRVHNREALAQRFRLVLVDESQDNDPLQWEIFEAAFADHMITVGDPKQAIYRFRGADVYSYLRQARDLPLARLSTNYRSDPDLVGATNLLLDGLRLGHDRIEVHPVRSADGRADAALAPGAPLDVRRVPFHPAIIGSRGAAVNDKATEVVLSDLTRVVENLLATTTLDDGDGPRPVRAGDIAVLVGTGMQAEQVMQTLLAAGVPAVRTRTGSVFETDAVREWRTLLFALSRPSDVSRVSAAALGLFFDASPSDLDPSNDGTTIVELQRRCGDWAARLARSSWLAWYDHVRRESGLVVRLLARPDGERMLTDLDHLAELLAADLGSVRPTAALALRRLDHLSSRPRENGEESDPEMRRIDSDASAVKISTIHASKGLEYPIVLLPYLWQGPKDSTINVFNDDDGVRFIDVATPYKWFLSTEDGTSVSDLDEYERRLSRTRHAVRGDRLRLLYVALTRARHRTVVWWAPTESGKKSPLGAVLFDRDDDLAPLNSMLDAAVTSSAPLVFTDGVDPQALDRGLAGRLGALADASDGRLSCSTVDPELPSATIPAAVPGADSAALAVADGRPIDEPAWKRWSFTSITRQSEAAVPDTPVTGGTDESDPTDLEDDAVVRSAVATSGVSMPWAEIGGGAAFGTMVHDVFERIDPLSTSLRADLEVLTARRLSRSGLDVDCDVVVQGVESAMSTPLGPLFDDRRLVDIGREDRLAELRFDLPLVPSEQSFGAPMIGQVLLATLADDDPVRDYATDVASGRLGVRLAGFLQGSIDAVLRVGSPDEPSFVVVDYKTNRLHDRDASDPLAAYHPDRLPDAMAHSDYPLQALLYSVALHRYLRWRLTDYDPERHLGGIGYLFLRGMVGRDTPRADGRPFGVFAWRPPAATIEALDQLLATGVAA